jgi:hypothetical protein
MPASNKRFGEIGVEVITRILLCPLTVGDSPNCVRLSPNFAKPPGRYVKCGGSAAAKHIRQKKTGIATIILIVVKRPRWHRWLKPKEKINRSIQSGFK